MAIATVPNYAQLLIEYGKQNMEIVQKVSGSNLLDIEAIRQEFPMLAKKINGRHFVYLDSAATAQKPACVIKALEEFYLGKYGKPKEKHFLSRNATQAVEEARKKIAKFFGASEKEIVFTRGCTESINIVAGGFAKLLKKNDEILITQLEHHANIVPWQMACELSNAQLKVVPILPNGELDMNAYSNMLSDKTKVVAVAHSPNALGTIFPVKEICRLAHKYDAAVLVDGAQAAPHMPVNVKDLDSDFYVMSGHKMGAPTGIGILHGKKKWLEKLPPFEGGSDMAKEVSFEKFTYQGIPQKFEAGTTPFAEIIAFGTLIDFVNKLDIEKTSKYEQSLLKYATEKLSTIAELTIVGTAPEKERVLSFHLNKKDVKKLEKYLDEEHNIFVRAGDLSTQPLMKVLGVKGLLRASMCYYNTRVEIDTFVAAVKNFLKK